MQELLKQVKEIFSEAEIIDYLKYIAPAIKIDIGGDIDYFWIERRGGGFGILVGENTICHSKDFSKILAVLKAIKECE
jgi:hypothetical protein